MSKTTAKSTPTTLPQYPEPIDPPIDPVALNEPVLLSSGPTKVTEAGTEFTADVFLHLSWIPTPRVRFEYLY